MRGLGDCQPLSIFDFENTMDTVERGAIVEEKKRDGDAPSDVEKQAGDGGRGLMDATG
jgi:hypothetical protein